MLGLLNPTVDFVFKRIFGDERNADVLVHFLNSIFENAGDMPKRTLYYWARLYAGQMEERLQLAKRLLEMKDRISPVLSERLSST